MRKLSLALLALVLVLFTQCEKEPLPQNNDEKMVPIRFEVPVNDGKTDFSDFLTDHNTQNAVINWNSTGTETIYLAVPNIRIYHPVTGDVLYEDNVAQMVSLTAECNGSSKLVFSGSVNSRILEDGKSYTLYYFGNNGGQDIIDETNGKLVGKTMSFENQDGLRESLGNYHVAILDVSVKANLNTSNVATSYQIMSSYPDFTSLTSIALLDLEGESKLEGTAVPQEFKLEFDSESNTYKTTYTMSESGLTLDGATSNSFITLFPTSAGTTLECGKGQYVFENGVESNSVYYSYNATSQEIGPLKWQPKK